MIQRSRFLKAASWMCIMLTVNVCVCEAVLARGAESVRPDGARTASEGGSGSRETYRPLRYIQLAQSDTTGVSVKPEPLEAGRIRFVRLPGREGLSTLWPRDTHPPSTSTDNSSSVGDRAVASRVWFLPGRDGFDAPGTRHWRKLDPGTRRSDRELLPLSVTDGPQTGNDRLDYSRPVYRKWWFWAIGVVAIGTTAALLAREDEAEADVPRRNLPDFPGPPES